MIQWPQLPSFRTNCYWSLVIKHVGTAHTSAVKTWNCLPTRWGTTSLEQNKRYHFCHMMLSRQISRGVPCDWPPMSPDLNWPDFWSLLELWEEPCLPGHKQQSSAVERLHEVFCSYDNPQHTSKHVDKVRTSSGHLLYYQKCCAQPEIN
jgi:hypothetical protein